MSRTINSSPIEGYSAIREARIKKGLTQEQLAELVGSSTWSIRHYECMKHMPRLGMAIELCKALDLNLEDVMRVVK